MKRTYIFIAATIALGLVFAGCKAENASTGSAGQTTPSATASAGTAQATSGNGPNSTAAPDTTGATAKPTSIPGLVVKDLKVGTGAEAVPGTTVTVNYTGWLTDGTKFDSSVDRNQPFDFQLGAGNVIPGWDKGVVGMKVGGKRKLTISPELGYGAAGAGPIPPNSTLIFDVELLGVK